jgi:hypothetical protein
MREGETEKNWRENTPTELRAEGLWQKIAKNLQNIPNTNNYRLRDVLKFIFKSISEDT